MLSDKQRKEKIDKVKRAVDLFLKTNSTIDEISFITKIPSSTVQRYLNDEEYIKLVFGNNYNLIVLRIKSKLLNNKIEGNKKGGIIYRENNESVKDNNGHFMGSIKR